ncbi:unnamed protein product [Allacma fusca]|uniref:C2 domain-containing protein n=1 Tax=Allacma fusca TaxID=39272 RepID=A0A8J2PYV6_9HEXA|nr:unnamed protein product [Allacma fusca]
MAAAIKAANRAKLAAIAVCNINGRDDAWKPPTGITSTIEISIACRNLVNVEILSKSDPMCVVLYRPPGSKNWVPLMRTEVVDNDLNPDFARKVIMVYRFDSAQKLRFEVYDVDSEDDKTSSENSLGYVETLLSHIVTAGEAGLTLELIGVALGMEGDEKPETIILTAEELDSEKDEVFLKLAGISCGTWTACIPPKTMFALSKINEAGKYIMVHRSAWARGSNPTWSPLRMSSRLLCNGDQDRELKLEIFQKDFKGNSHSNGVCITTLNKLLAHCDKQDSIELSDTKPQLQDKSAIRVAACTLTPIHTFVEYIQAGTQIHCCFAIDFTCSNGDPADILSLHFISKTGNNPNPYEQAIEAVGTILEDYNEVTSFPTYGFGARIPPKGVISYDFNVNLTEDPNCGTVPGVLEAYRHCLTQIQLYGPTNFAPIIKNVATIASNSKAGQDYYVLVIITDGVISDMAKTKKEIVAASSFPLSIIIIGVGEADFDAMEELDGDALRLSYNGKVAERDIVQFVAYRSARSWLASTGERTANELENEDEDEPVVAQWDNYAGKAFDDDEPVTGEKPPEPVEEDKETRLGKSALGREVLAEIPDQLTSYMKTKGIFPGTIVKRPREVWVPPKKPDEEWDKVLEAAKNGEEGNDEDADEDDDAVTEEVVDK